MFKKIPDEQYFLAEALSQSGVKRILKAPAEFLSPLTKTPAMFFGNVVHCLTLEPERFSSAFAVSPICDRRTKAGKDAYSEIQELSAGKDVITPEDYETANKCTAAALGYRMTIGKDEVIFSDMLAICRKEVALFWDQEFDIDGDVFSVPCKAKFDAISEEHKIIFDIKTAVDASPDGFRKQLYNQFSGYYIQSAFYRLHPELRDYKFCFVVVEKKEPFCVGMYFPDDTTREHATGLISHAAWIYKQGMETGIWSSQYNDAPEELIPPGWFWMTQK